MKQQHLIQEAFNIQLWKAKLPTTKITNVYRFVHMKGIFLFEFCLFLICL